VDEFEVKAGDRFRVKRRKRRRDNGFAGFTVRKTAQVDGKTQRAIFEFTPGLLVQASDSCDPDFHVANLNAKPVPLVRGRFIESNLNSFERVED